MILVQLPDSLNPVEALGAWLASQRQLGTLKPVDGLSEVMP